MINCKAGPFWDGNAQRMRANNSAVILRHKIEEDVFYNLWKRIEDGGTGEPGLYFTNDKDWGTNPCCEIALRPYQFCNLTECNVSNVKGQEDLNNRVKAAAFLGTLQASYTDFHYLRDIWQDTTEKDALLGVSMTGLASNKVADLDVTGSVSGGLSSTGSFGHVEQLGVKLVDSNQTASFASGSDLHAILAESSSYMVSDQTGSMGTTTISSTLFVQDGITTSGSITAREFKTEFVSSSIIYASGSNQFGDTGDDVHEFSGSLKIGNLTFSTSSIGIQSDTDLISLSDDTFTLNGSIVINDGANIGIDSDTDLLDLNDQNLIINGKLDSTGRIDAQNGLQVSGSTLAVGNDLTLDYTSPVSHSLVFVNHTNKTIDLVPAASASGQLVQYDGSGWVITDEIDGGSY